MITVTNNTEQPYQGQKITKSIWTIWNSHNHSMSVMTSVLKKKKSTKFRQKHQQMYTCFTITKYWLDMNDFGKNPATMVNPSILTRYEWFQKKIQQQLLIQACYITIWILLVRRIKMKHDLTLSSLSCKITASLSICPWERQTCPPPPPPTCPWEWQTCPILAPPPPPIHLSLRMADLPPPPPTCPWEWQTCPPPTVQSYANKKLPV